MLYQLHLTYFTYVTKSFKTSSAILRSLSVHLLSSSINTSSFYSLFSFSTSSFRIKDNQLIHEGFLQSAQMSLSSSHVEHALMCPIYIAETPTASANCSLVNPIRSLSSLIRIPTSFKSISPFTFHSLYFHKN